MDARKLLLLLILMILAPLAMARGASVAVLAEKEVASVTALAVALGKSLEASTEVVLLADGFTTGSHYDAIILAGPEALVGWARLPYRPKAPLVSAFVSRQDLADAGQAVASAVYLEPPLVRQIQLAQGVLGGGAQLGVLASTHRQIDEQGGVGRLRRLGAEVFVLDDYDTLNRALADLLRDNIAVIGIYDPELFNAANIKNILITAYRQNRPLIGPSSAYIRAGALATTFSDIDDIAFRLAEILRTGLAHNEWEPPDYNPYFQVRYNQQVARSLNLNLPAEEQVARELGSRRKP